MPSVIFDALCVPLVVAEAATEFDRQEVAAAELQVGAGQEAAIQRAVWVPMLVAKPLSGFGRPLTVGLVNTSMFNAPACGKREYRRDAVIDAENDAVEARAGCGGEDPAAASW